MRDFVKHLESLHNQDIMGARINARFLYHLSTLEEPATNP